MTEGCLTSGESRMMIQLFLFFSFFLWGGGGRGVSTTSICCYIIFLIFIVSVQYFKKKIIETKFKSGIDKSDGTVNHTSMS